MHPAECPNRPRHEDRVSGADRLVRDPATQRIFASQQAVGALR